MFPKEIISLNIGSLWRSCSLLCCIGISLNVCTVVAHLGPHEEIQRINSELNNDRDNKDLLARRAFLFRAAAHPIDSLTEYNALLQKYPEDFDLYYQRALTFLDLQEYKKADSDLTYFINNKVNAPKVYAMRARIREELKKYDSALEDYQKAARSKQREEFYVRFGDLYFQLGDYSSSENVYRQGLGAYVNSIVLTQKLVRLEIVLKKFKAAHTLVDSFIQKRNFKTPWLLLQAEIHEAAGNQNEARLSRQKALVECKEKLTSGKAKGIHKIYTAEVLFVLGNTEKASRIIATVLREYPQSNSAVELKQRIDAEREMKNVLQWPKP